MYNVLIVEDDPMARKLLEIFVATSENYHLVPSLDSAAMGAETLTNAVRHAGAKQLWIDMEQTETAHIIRYTNDGDVPTGPVTEGGGLSTARRKIESAGGQMRIGAEPRFMLTIIFEKGVTMDV